MAPPKVSIILTVFKRTEFLGIALQSALNQSFDDFEVIVTDDSASPAIAAICAQFQSEKIRYRRNESTLGVVLNLRAAVAEARGTYIAILNDDDLWEADFLARLVSALDQDAARVLAFSDHWIVDAKGAVDLHESEANSARYGRAALPPGDVADFGELVVVRNGVPLAMASVFRADAVPWERVGREVTGAYDYWIACLLAAGGGKACYEPARLTRYRVHGAMETGRRAADKNDNQVYINRALIAEPAFAKYRELLVRRYAAAQFHVGRDRLVFGLVKDARKFLLGSLRTRFDAKAMACWCLTFLPAPLRSAVIGRFVHPVAGSASGAR